MTKSAFHELGLADADELVVKSRLMRFLAEEIRKRGLTQKAAGKLLDLDQSNLVDEASLVHHRVVGLIRGNFQRRAGDAASGERTGDEEHNGAAHTADLS